MQAGIVLRPTYQPIAQAAAQFAVQKYADLPPVMATMPLAMRGAPNCGVDFHHVLLQSRIEGRCFRALLGLNAPISDQTLAIVSNMFTRSLRSELNGERHLITSFTALSDAKSTLVYDPDGVDFTLAVPRNPYFTVRLDAAQEVRDPYFLSSVRPVSAVLDGEHCGCCFDTAYLDYLKATFDLTKIGNTLIARMRGAGGKNDVKIAKGWLQEPLLGWMRAAGFSVNVFLAKERIEWNGEVFNYSGDEDEVAELFCLPIPDRVEARVILEELEMGPLEFPYYNYAAFFVFQRESYAPHEQVQRILEEAMDWERANITNRRNPVYLKDSERAIGRFMAMVPNLVANTPQSR